MRKAAMTALAAIAGLSALVWSQGPEVRRYLKIKRM